MIKDQTLSIGGLDRKKCAKTSMNRPEDLPAQELMHSERIFLLNGAHTLVQLTMKENQIFQN